VFLTNNFTLSAEMIAALYKKRWAVELFFGSSANRVGNFRDSESDSGI
jgi:IS4 transposase